MVFRQAKLLPISQTSFRRTDELLEESVAPLLEDLGEDEGEEAAAQLDEPQQHQYHHLGASQVHGQHCGFWGDDVDI